jgi:cephalosporin hydroxylase
MLIFKERLYYRKIFKFNDDIKFTAAMAKYPSRNTLHAYAVHYYRYHLPFEIREHRKYFAQEQRGFGEDAFHTMWWMLLREFQPQMCLEIGIYRGQVISLWTLISQSINYPCEVHGISPFTSMGDSVSTYMVDVDYYNDTLNAFNHFNLPAPTLVKALSTDPEAINHIARRRWNLIYIDGSHDFEIALADYRLCRDHLVSGGLLVLDDASIGTSFRPPSFSFAGHPGPSRVAAEFAMKDMVFLGAVGHNNVFQKP